MKKLSRYDEKLFQNIAKEKGIKKLTKKEIKRIHEYASNYPDEEYYSWVRESIIRLTEEA